METNWSTMDVGEETTMENTTLTYIPQLTPEKFHLNIPMEFSHLVREEELHKLKQVFIVRGYNLLSLFRTYENTPVLFLAYTQGYARGGENVSRKNIIKRLRQTARTHYDRIMSKLFYQYDKTRDTPLSSWLEVLPRIQEVCWTVWQETVCTYQLMCYLHPEEQLEDLQKREEGYFQLGLLIGGVHSIKTTTNERPFLFSKEKEKEIMRWRDQFPITLPKRPSAMKGTVRRKSDHQAPMKTSNSLVGMTTVSQGFRNLALARTTDTRLAEERGIQAPLHSSHRVKLTRHLSGATELPTTPSRPRTAGGGGGDPEEPADDDEEDPKDQPMGGSGRNNPGRDKRDDEKEEEDNDKEPAVPERNKYGRRSLQSVYTSDYTGEKNNPRDLLLQLLASHASNSAQDERIPLFYGDQRRWEEWYSLFLALIHNDTTIPDIIKYKRLRGSLGPEPLELISSLEFNERTYDLAFGVLEQHYGDPERLLENLRHKITTFPNFGEGKIDQFRQFVNLVQQTSQHLATYQPGVYCNPELWLKEIEKKLPPRCLDRWYEILESEVFQEKKPSPSQHLFPELLKFLPDYYSRTTRVQESRAVLREKDEGGDTKRTNLEQKNSRRTAKSFATQVNFEEEENSDSEKRDKQDIPEKLTSEKVVNHGPNCLICGKSNHETNRCFIKKDPNELFKLVLNVRACFNCLRAGHTVTECKAKSCDVRGCGKRHHRFLHGKTSFLRQHKPRKTPAPKGTNRSNYSCNLKL